MITKVSYRPNASSVSSTQIQQNVNFGVRAKLTRVKFNDGDLLFSVLCQIYSTGVLKARDEVPKLADAFMKILRKNGNEGLTRQMQASIKKFGWDRGIAISTDELQELLAKEALKKSLGLKK